jgi:UDP-N-acetylbacillosamine N-acetyltransferase
MQKKVAIWGASGHALVVADILRLQGEYEIVGLLDDLNPERCGQQTAGLTVLGGREQFEVLRDRRVTHLIFGFGDCSTRLRLTSVAKENGFEFATAIHPRAVVAADAAIGVGTVIVAGAVVNPGARIGANTIINTCASVDHECVIGDAVHVGPGAHLGGRVKVGDEVWIGMGATVLDRRQIGARSIVGAGSLVTKNVDADVVVYGVPARKIRSVEAQIERWQKRSSVMS